MKSVNAKIATAIRSDYEVVALPRLTVEWNQNRYASSVSVDNTPSEDTDGQDIEIFPIESLIAPNRPTAGALKARLGESKVSDPHDSSLGRIGRYYTCDPEDVYKYWTSPVQTGSDSVFPLHTDSQSVVRPHVIYGSSVKANKIVVGFEDTWAQPNSFEVMTTTDGTNWSVVATKPSINAQGQVILYYNGTGWSSSKPSNQTSFQSIRGIQVRVNSLQGTTTGSADGANVFCSVIEISARFEQDITDRLVSVTDTFDIGENSIIYPMGTITSNVGNISLFNGDGYFNNENTNSPLVGLMEPNAVFNLEYIYTINGADYTVQQFKMYGGPWQGQNDDTVTVELTDFSKYFQEIKPRASMYRNVTPAEVVAIVCDSVGFTDYYVDKTDLTTHFKIPIWWCDGEKTVWEIFDELSKSSQTAIYFDAYGILQVRTRESAFDTTRATDWVLRGTDVGSELADIASLSQNDEIGSNSITVTYQTTEFDQEIKGLAKTQTLWEPDDTVALRAAPLARTLEKDSTFFWITPNEVVIWPFEGLINIQGELIRYKGKRFTYYEDDVAKTVTVTSQEEMEKFNAKTAFTHRHLNSYTGALVITERGVWNSENKRHTVEAEGYSVRHIINDASPSTSGVSGFSHAKKESRIYLTAVPKKIETSNDFLIATRGASDDTPFYYYGTKMRFEKGGHKYQQAGIVIHNNTTKEDGYYIDLTPTNMLPTSKDRDNRNELIVMSRVDGSNHRLNGQGKALNIVEGVDYEVDVTYKPVGSNHRIRVWVNGMLGADLTISGSDKNPQGGKFGVFLRGDTKVSYEYIYAIARNEDDIADDFTYLDRVRRDYFGGQWDREWVYKWRTRKRRVKKHWTKEKYRWNEMFYDDFGPYVHELREFSVKFEPSPALTSRLYLGNDYSIICPEYKADSFGAKFYLANTIRQTAIANGEDLLTYAGSSTPVNPILAVIGRAIVINEAETILVKDEEQIRARGPVETEISSPWIQNKVMAQSLADWIKQHWSKGVDELEVTIFGNPLLEVGDLVTIDYPRLNMSPTTHKYFVISTSSSFTQGLETTLNLRRMV